MSAVDGLIFGRAVFLTGRGLEARGNGILAGVQEAPGVFEFGRTREHPLHKIDGNEESALFCRRGVGIRRGRALEIELVGLIAPTKDAEGRSGFFGAGVALDADRRQPGGFGNWGGCEKEIRSFFSHSRAMFHDRGPVSFLHEVPFAATDHEEEVDWSSTTNEEILLQYDGGAEGVWDAKVFEYLQAIAFKDGTNHPTILVFREAVSGSQSLASDQFQESLRLLSKAKSEQLEGKDVAGVPSEDPFGGGAQALTGSTIERVYDLEKRVQRLERIVNARRTPAVVSTGSEAYGEEIPLVWIIAGIAGGVLAIVVGVLMYFVLTGWNS